MIKGTVRLDMTPAERLKNGGIRKATRIGLNRASSPVKAAVVSHADAGRRFGFLGKSIRIRLRSYPADRWVSVIGPSTKFTRTKGKYKRGKRKGEARVFKPSKYAHLVNAGTKRSKATHWLDQAHAEAAPRFLADVGREVGAEISKQLARAGG